MEIREAAEQAKLDFEAELGRYLSTACYTPEEAGEWVAARIVQLMEDHLFT